VVPCWILQDPQAAPYVTQGELVLLLDRFLYGLKQSPLKFQLHITKLPEGTRIVLKTPDVIHVSPSM